MFYDFQNSQTFVLVEWLIEIGEAPRLVRQALALAAEEEALEAADEVEAPEDADEVSTYEAADEILEVEGAAEMLALDDAAEILADLLKERVEIGIDGCVGLYDASPNDILADPNSLVGKLLEVIVPEIRFKVAADALLEKFSDALTANSVT